MHKQAFCNPRHPGTRPALMYRALDQFALGIDHDWSAELLKFYDGFKKQACSTESNIICARIRKRGILVLSYKFVPSG